MTKLEELIYSLATVIVRYHDSQPKVLNKLVVESEYSLVRKKSRELAMSIIQNKEIKYEQNLKGIAEACTKGYPDRKHFLAFILHEINFLKAQLDRKTPYSDKEFAEYPNQIATLLLDFNQLLKTLKGTMHKVTYSDFYSDEPICIDLSGLKNTAWVGKDLCNSGLFLVEEVLGRFHMTINDSDDEIKEIAVSLCMEHQNALCVPDLQRQKLDWEAQKLELESQKSAIEVEKLHLESQKPELEAEKLEVESQKAALGAQKLHLDSQKAELESQKQQVKSQKATLDAQKQQVQKQQAELDAQKQHIKTQKSELDGQSQHMKKLKSELDTQKQLLESQKSAFEVEKLHIESQKSAFGAQKLKLDSQKSDLEAQKLQFSKQKSEMEAQKLQIKTQSSELDTQILQIKTQKSELDAQKFQLEKQSSELEAQKKGQESTISSLESELDKARAELQKIQSEFESYKEKEKQKQEEPASVFRRIPGTTYPYPLGLGAFGMFNQKRLLGPGSQFFLNNTANTSSGDSVDNDSGFPVYRE